MNIVSRFTYPESVIFTVSHRQVPFIGDLPIFFFALFDSVRERGVGGLNRGLSRSTQIARIILSGT